MENMDCLSQKIELRFSLGLNKKISKQLTSTSNYKLLADIEGVFQISIYDQLFFDDPYILLFELGLELSKWRKKTEYEDSVDFSYKTMDYDDEAILLFKKCMDRNNW